MKGLKGQLGNLQSMMFTLLIVGALIAAGFFTIGEFSDQTVEMTGSNSSAAALSLNKTLNAFQTLPDLLPIIILIMMIVIILGLVFLIPGSRSAGA